MAAPLDILASLLPRGRKWRRGVHLYSQTMKTQRWDKKHTDILTRTGSDDGALTRHRVNKRDVSKSSVSDNIHSAETVPVKRSFYTVALNGTVSMCRPLVVELQSHRRLMGQTSSHIVDLNMMDGEKQSKEKSNQFCLSVWCVTSATRGHSIKTIAGNLVWRHHKAAWDHGSWCLYHHCWWKSTWCDIMTSSSPYCYFSSTWP